MNRGNHDRAQLPNDRGALGSGAEPGCAMALPAYVGRQPMYNRQLQTVAYELLFRGGGGRSAHVTDQEQATAEVVVAALADFGLDRLAFGRRVFINASRDLLMSPAIDVLPADRVGLEVLESVRVDATLLTRLKQLAARGYPVALDDFVLTNATRPLLDVAVAVKLDVRALSSAEVERHVRDLAGYPIRLLAEKIEDRAMFDRCRDQGFDYFQGYVFGRPETLVTTRVPEAAQANIQLLAELQRPGATLEDVEAVIVRDVGISMRLLRYVNSAAVALPRQIGSIHEAVMLLGEHTVRNFASMIVLARTTGDAGELIRTATIRAKMLELIARSLNRPDPDTHFTVGLLSVVDDLLAKPMADILADLPLDPDLTAALTTGTGRLGAPLSLVLAYEHGWIERLTTTPLKGTALRNSYLRAIEWADQTTSHLHTGRGAVFARAA